MRLRLLFTKTKHTILFRGLATGLKALFHSNFFFEVPIQGAIGQ